MDSDQEARAGGERGRDQAAGAAAGRAAGRRVTAGAAVTMPPRDVVPESPRDVDQARQGDVGETSRNDVALRGRVSGEPQVRELPSGDALVSWRLVVNRPPGSRRSPEGVRATTVDTLDCVAWTAGLRREARALVDGDVVEVSGALRRRFWRSGAGAASRYEVEVSALTRISRREAAR